MRKEIEDTCLELLELLRKKNADYGDSFHRSWEEYGPVQALIRMEDKLNRLKTLLLSGAAPNVKSEPVRDTMMDLAGYAVLSVAELERSEEKEGSTHPNGPLTLEELRQMDGEPVWVECLTNPKCSCWGYHDEDGFNSYCAYFDDDEYGKVWLAYRRKPEEAQTK